MSQDWLKSLLLWLRKLLGEKAGRPSTKIIEQYHGDNVSVLRLIDPTIPGAVDLWRIDRHHERIKFFILVINTSQLREELAGLGNRSHSAGSRGRLAGDFWQQIQTQRDILATHFWVVGWDKEVSGTDNQGRNYRSHRIDSLAVYAVDLQGIAASYAGDRYATRFARKIIKRLAAYEFRELSHHRTWVAAVQSVDWLQWLEGLSRSRNGIGPDHTLQPKVSRSPKSKP